MSAKGTHAAVAGPAAPAAAPTLAGKPSLVMRIASRFGVDADKMLDTLKQTAFRTEKPASNEQMMALLVVAEQYGLNPWTKEIYAFEDKYKGIVPVVSIDGWVRIINERPELDFITFDYAPDDSEDAWIECTIGRKDRSRPIVVREYLKECYRDTGPWKSHPRRMLRHKTLIQCARVAFGFAGIYDPDEAERIRDANAIEGSFTAVSTKPATEAPKAIESKTEAPNVVPVGDLQRLIDKTGIPESDFLHRFEIDCIESLPLSRVGEAFEYLHGINAG